MLLRVVRKLSLSDQVFEQLAREIVSGRCKPGTQLPPERSLVQSLKVNRHVVREALKRLEQLGLIKIAQGGGTTVLDFRHHAGLDLLALMAETAQASEKSMTYWLAVHEMRAVIGADTARLCALRGSKEIKKTIVDVASKMAEIADGTELFALELRFWELVVEGAGNIVYQLAFNSLIKGVLAPAVADLAREWSVYEVKQSAYRVPIATAIAMGDARGAESKTREAMNLVFVFLAKKRAATTEPLTEAAADVPAPRRVASRKPRRE
jgi:GntR family transcriptional regulator, transcriptional repressor for pyruvate dehydrogenase complex